VIITGKKRDFFRGIYSESGYFREEFLVKEKNMQPVYTFASEEDELRFKEIVFNEMMSEMHKERGIVKTGKQIREEVYNAYFKNKLLE
jgi:Zn-dependent M16 (insulinase) family peptidase